MNRDELLTKLATKLAEWPKDLPGPNLPGLWSCHHVWRCHAVGDMEPIFEHDWLHRRAELINKPDWRDAPEWAVWLAQDADGDWFWHQNKPFVQLRAWTMPAPKDEGQSRASEGAIPRGHDWRETLERRPTTASLDAADFDEERIDIISTNGNDGLHYMTPEEQELPAEERHDCDRCGGSWWSPKNEECPCQASRSDGSTVSYYELPEGATELQDLISYRNLNGQDAEMFRAIYRKGRASHSDALRDAKKVLFYAEAEVRRLERYGQ